MEEADMAEVEDMFEEELSLDDLCDEAPATEAPEEYGPFEDEDPPGAPTPPDLEDQNSEEGTNA